MPQRRGFDEKMKSNSATASSDGTLFGTTMTTTGAARRLFGGAQLSLGARAARHARGAVPTRVARRMFVGGVAIGTASAVSFTPVHAEQAAAAVKPLVVFVLGGPGAGKGTMCANLVEDYGFVHLSAGDLLRAERKKGGELGDLINNYIKEGAIVPNEITCRLILEAMQQSQIKKFLVDGYPRNLDNRQGWEETVGDDVDLAGVLYFDCPEDKLVERIVERGKTSGRVDDNADAMVKRLRVYKNETSPVLDYFDRKGLVTHVNTGGTPEEVYSLVQRAVKPIVEFEVSRANGALLASISGGDFATYSTLCSSDITCFDSSETGGNLVEGLDFHQFYFDNANVLDVSARSTVSQPSVKLLSPKVMRACVSSRSGYIPTEPACILRLPIRPSRSESSWLVGWVHVYRWRWWRMCVLCNRWP